MVRFKEKIESIQYFVCSDCLDNSRFEAVDSVLNGRDEWRYVVGVRSLCCLLQWRKIRRLGVHRSKVFLGWHLISLKSKNPSHRTSHRAR